MVFNIYKYIDFEIKDILDNSEIVIPFNNKTIAKEFIFTTILKHEIALSTYICYE